MQSYTFRVILEEDTFPDGSMGYFVAVPELKHLGAATQGRTPEEALARIEEVLRGLVEDLVAAGETVPNGAVAVSKEPRVTVTV